MLNGMFGKMRFNRPINEADFISLGGFEFVTRGGKVLSFDFNDCSGNITGNNRDFYEFKATNPDTDSFEDIPNYTVEDFENVIRFNEFNVDSALDDLYPISIVFVTMSFTGDERDVRLPLLMQGGFLTDWG